MFSSSLGLIQSSKDIDTFKPRMSAPLFKCLLRDSVLERAFIVSSPDYPNVAYLEVPEWEDNHRSDLVPRYSIKRAWNNVRTQSQPDLSSEG